LFSSTIFNFTKRIVWRDDANRWLSAHVLHRIVVAVNIVAIKLAHKRAITTITTTITTTTTAAASRRGSVEPAARDRKHIAAGLSERAPRRRRRRGAEQRRQSRGESQRIAWHRPTSVVGIVARLEARRSDARRPERLE
jgi:hypothetical protein